MRLTDFINKDAVCIDLKSNDKTAVLYELVDILLKSGGIKNGNSNKEKLFNILCEREKLGSTGITNGAAIPHGKSDMVKRITIAIGISPNGVDFDSIDGGKTCIFALLIAPSSSAAPHLRALARIARLFKNKIFRHVLINTKSPEDVIKLIATEEKNSLRDQ
ncbi:PTS sugar transporter subunit IIA [bacterium]|nr:PTS sugar transporter subunit IIA [bacterium]